ncbi:purine nucleoside phosphorylase YfiH [Dickeya oryzae]|uniref:purine nucleoside phosphorylase YfiH n=1 Tax=Dickeya oryzae TaxID=1240404 RepID=UPI002096C02E|nr:purine nucleoside phosphorylase YfiH [Dickeya oryzae]MCO7256489.1 purine nucleoside phosphorylase YfiH [Dickeya oryzae]UUE12075.1 purine nucleoside phosphorylase YfiH [Dickeya zeae]
MMLIPDWPAPARVRACSTTRLGGVSSAPYDSLNLGNHVGDSPLHVKDNRQRLLATAGLPVMPHWLQQVHGTQVINLDQVSSDSLTGDAAYTTRQDRVCAVMTADCLPVLFCSANGDEVAAAHAGWRGLQAGVLEETLRHFHARPADILAWMGPAIGPQQFEVGGEVREAFLQVDPIADCAFVPRNGKFLADIYQLARLRLEAAGVTQVFGGEYCTVSDSGRFFSYRRDGMTGRMATLIWLI